MIATPLLLLLSAIPPEIEASKSAFCIVREPLVLNVPIDRGSGVLLQGPAPWVLSCYHVTGGPGSPVECVFGSQVVKGTVWRALRNPDAAVIRLEKRPDGVQGIPIARYMLARGETGYAVGFGGLGAPMRIQVGRRVDANLVNEGWFELTGTARQGDSGGPVCVIRKGRLAVVGVLIASGQGTILGVRVHVFRRFFGMRVFRNAKRASPVVLPPPRAASSSRAGNYRVPC